MTCPACGHSNRDTARFCDSCGSALGRRCALCHAELRDAARFCDSCGQAVAAAAPDGEQTPALARPLPSSFCGGRYAVRALLGEGAKKRVYLAHDTKLGRDIAFALIKTDGLDADGLSRVRREAQAMARLGDHPNIVTVYDIGDETGDGGRTAPYIVAQHMGGGDLAGLIDHTEQRRLPVADVLRIAGEICEGLRYAHASGIVHRDLKPGNVWLSEGGTAKIGDFGLALTLDRSRLTMPGMMVGTAAYMSPEQAMGGATGAASDLYALGCIIYEMVCGRPPFLGDDAVAVISQHVNTPPVAPSWHNPQCPPLLETLTLRLLAKDAAQRPASAADVGQALASIDVAAKAAEATPAAAPEGEHTSPIYRRTFVGRESELKQLQSILDAALSGRGGLVMIVGEPGIGKTTLTEQLTTYVAMRGGRTLMGHCYEEGSLALPYLPFVEAMRSYALARDGEQLASELGTGAGEVARIVSEIRDRVAVESPPAGSPEEERFRLFQAVTAFLRNASEAQPLCIVLEDLHDGDKGTMELLVHLARNLSGARLLLVGTYRDVEVDRKHPLSAALADLRRVESFTRVPLRGLSPDEVHRMMSNIAGQDVQYPIAEAVYRQTEGNPLFIQEVIRYAAESGLIKREGGQWVATVDSLLTQIPEGLRDVIGRRLTRLSESCNRILSVAAVMGRDFSLAVLQQVAGVPEEELLGAIEEAVRVSLLEERSESRDVRYRFTHAFFRQTLYEEMIAPRRLRLHNEVAKALERHYANRLDDHAVELAEHFAHSSTEDDLRKAVHYSERAAQRAAEVYAHGEAARLLEQAVQVQEVLDPADREKRFGLMLSLAGTLLSAGEPQRVSGEVAPELWEIAQALGDGERKAAAAEVAAWGLAYYGAGPVFVSGEWQTWMERLDQHAPPESRLRAVSDILMSWTHYGFRRQRECWELRRRGLELARRIGDPDALANAMFSFISAGAPLQLEAERLRVAEEFAEVPRAGMRPGTLGNILYARGLIFLNAGRRDAADAVWQELTAYAARVGDPYVRAWQMFAETQGLLLDGELERSVELAERFSASASALGIEVFGQGMSAWASGFALLRLGRAEEALADRSAWDALIFGDAAVARMLASAGHIDDARREVRRIVREREIGAGEDWNDDATLLTLLGTAVLTSDAETAAMLSRRLSGAADLHLLQAGGSVAGQLALSARLLGDPAAARAHFVTALDVASRVRDRPEVALVHLGMAQLLFEDYPDEREEARRHLDIALNEFQAMKMQAALEEAMRLKMRDQGIDASAIHTSIDRVAESVQREQPVVTVAPAPDGTVTIMFSDIEDSAALTEQLGDQRWQELLRRHNATIRAQIRAHGGFEVKTMGDGFMVAFQSARKGLECAIAVQRAFAAHQTGADETQDADTVRVRIGLHAGEAVREGGDFFGRNVVMASRVAGQAIGGEILVSSILRTLVESAVDPGMFSESRQVELKGLTGVHTVYPVAWNC